MVVPFVISVISAYSWRSIGRTFKAFLPFYLFLPTLVAWFGTYSLARFSDISWGNRPTDQQVVQAQGNNRRTKVFIF